MSVLHYPSSRQESVSSSSSLPAITSLSLIRVTERLGRPSKRDWPLIGEKVIVRRKLCSIEQLEAILEITDSNTVLYFTCLLFCLFISYIFLNVDTYLSILGEKDFILNLWNPVIYILEYFILDLDSVIIKIIYWYI